MVSHNTRELLCRCLTAIVEDVPEIVVVDNASADGSADLIEQRFEDVRVIKSELNLGFGKAANLGIKSSSRPFVLLLNADVWPVGMAVPRLVQFMRENPRVGLAGPQLLDPEGRPTRSAIRHPSGGLTLALWTLLPSQATTLYGVARRLRYATRPAHLAESEFLMGAALLVRREAFADVDGFDEDFFMFSEEVDLCKRLRTVGWRVALVPGAAFVHVGGSSTQREPELMYREALRSNLRLLAKHRGLHEAERARRLVLQALKLKARMRASPEERVAVAWLDSQAVGQLLREPTR